MTVSTCRSRILSTSAMLQQTKSTCSIVISKHYMLFTFISLHTVFMACQWGQGDDLESLVSWDGLTVRPSNCSTLFVQVSRAASSMSTPITCELPSREAPIASLPYKQLHWKIFSCPFPCLHVSASNFSSLSEQYMVNFASWGKRGSEKYLQVTDSSFIR